MPGIFCFSGPGQKKDAIRPVMLGPGPTTLEPLLRHSETVKPHLCIDNEDLSFESLGLFVNSILRVLQMRHKYRHPSCCQ
jgi:hypothetical protein